MLSCLMAKRSSSSSRVPTPPGSATKPALSERRARDPAHSRPCFLASNDLQKHQRSQQLVKEGPAMAEGPAPAEAPP